LNFSQSLHLPLRLDRAERLGTIPTHTSLQAWRNRTRRLGPIRLSP